MDKKEDGEKNGEKRKSNGVGNDKKVIKDDFL